MNEAKYREHGFEFKYNVTRVSHVVIQTRFFLSLNWLGPVVLPLTVKALNQYCTPC